MVKREKTILAYDYFFLSFSVFLWGCMGKQWLLLWCPKTEAAYQAGKEERRGASERERLTHPDLWNRNKWMGEASPLSSSFFLSPACAKYLERNSALDSHMPFTLFPNEFPNLRLRFFLFYENPSSGTATMARHWKRTSISAQNSSWICFVKNSTFQNRDLNLSPAPVRPSLLSKALIREANIPVGGRGERKKKKKKGSTILSPKAAPEEKMEEDLEEKTTHLEKEEKRKIM